MDDDRVSVFVFYIGPHYYRAEIDTPRKQRGRVLGTVWSGSGKQWWWQAEGDDSMHGGYNSRLEALNDLFDRCSVEVALTYEVSMPISWTTPFESAVLNDRDIVKQLRDSQADTQRRRPWSTGLVYDDTEDFPARGHKEYSYPADEDFSPSGGGLGAY